MGLGSNLGPHPSSMGEPKVEEGERPQVWNESPGVAPTSSLDATSAPAPEPAPTPASAYQRLPAQASTSQRQPAPASACPRQHQHRLHLRPRLWVLSGIKSPTEWRTMVFTMVGHREHGKTTNRAQWERIKRTHPSHITCLNQWV